MGVRSGHDLWDSDGGDGGVEGDRSPCSSLSLEHVIAEHVIAYSRSHGHMVDELRIHGEWKSMNIFPLKHLSVE